MRAASTTACAVILALATASCSQGASTTLPSAPPSATPTGTQSANPSSPSPTLSPASATFRDGAFGYSLSYPSNWVELSAISRPGSDFFASRPGVATARDLGAGDYWLSARRFAPDPTIGCGAPSDGFSKLAGYGGRSWGLYSRQNGPSIGMSVADAVTVFDGWCYALQLIAGPGGGADATLELLDSIGRTFKFNVEPAAEPIAPLVGQRHLVASPGHSSPNGQVHVTGDVPPSAPILLDSRPRCISAVGPPTLSPDNGNLSLDVTMGSVFSGNPCPIGDVEVIIWVGYLPYDAVVVVGT